MKFGICKCCGRMATQTCSVCGGTVCIKCNNAYGCLVCRGLVKNK
ncbi:MAG: hypothetical protein PHU12_03860 [Candidatus Aenigmarchaeota archaeon]|nr:hypothetical protein [Candidatus Aenigmarchaeota archaeon]